MRKNNTYPLHIEKQQEQLYVNAIKRISKIVIPKIRKFYKAELKTDADNFGHLENELLAQFKDELIRSGYMRNQIEKVAFLLDAWTIAKTKQQINRKTRSKKVFSNFKVDQFEIQPAIIILDPNDPIILDFIDTYIRQNVELVAALGREFIPDITELASQTYLQGGSLSDLSAQLVQFTEGNITRAAFWARDQVGTAYSQLTMTRQTQAGIIEYIWQTMGDNAVRGNDPNDQTSHIILQGQKFSWKSGAANTGQLSAPGAKHPGEDYNCRCTSDPVIE